MKHPRAFPPVAFRYSLHHFFLGGDYGIIIPRDGVEIPDKLYHVTSEKNLDNILKKGISSACGVVFLTDSFQDLEDYLEWKQIPARIGIEYFYRLSTQSFAANRA